MKAECLQWIPHAWKHKIGSGATLSQATMIFFSFQWHTSPESINNWNSKNKLKTRIRPWVWQKKIENGKRIVDILYLVYEDPTQ